MLSNRVYAIHFCIDALRLTWDREDTGVVDNLRIIVGPLGYPTLKNIHSTIGLGDRLSCAETISQSVFVHKNTKCGLRRFHSLTKEHLEWRSIPFFPAGQQRKDATHLLTDSVEVRGSNILDIKWRC